MSNTTPNTTVEKKKRGRPRKTVPIEKAVKPKVTKEKRGRYRKVVTPPVKIAPEPAPVMPVGRITPETHPNLFDDFGNPL